MDPQRDGVPLVENLSSVPSSHNRQLKTVTSVPGIACLWPGTYTPQHIATQRPIL